MTFILQLHCFDWVGSGKIIYDIQPYRENALYALILKYTTLNTMRIHLMGTSLSMKSSRRLYMDNDLSRYV